MAYHIAIVDDDATSLVDVRTLLIEKGMKVSCLKSGPDLLKFMEHHTPDLILLDVLMPEMDGFETLNKLRYLEENTRRGKTPVIFMTGDSDAAAERRGLKLGASDYIHKPINKEVITERINNTIKNYKTLVALTEEVSMDKLTGFLNKSTGTEKLSRVIEDVLKDATGLLVVFDLDNFKLVNDLFGHDVGDEVLISFSRVLRSHLSEDDIITRIGGDEFLGLIPGITIESDLGTLVKSLNEELFAEAERLMGDDFGIPLGISAGGVILNGKKERYETLFKMADAALYSVKNNGKHGYAVFDPSYDIVKLERDDLENELTRITHILDERNDSSSAVLLGADAFTTCYRFIMRMCRIHDVIPYGVVFALSGDKDSVGHFMEAVESLTEILKNKLRISDVFYQNIPGQFFSVLPSIEEEGVKKIISDVVAEWECLDCADSVSLEYTYREIRD